ncbi:MAG: LysR family transcriptional regulator [Deltaproteobacteria bacterium]|nr:LysR family transcriptional regulator [Deltaproteobacteria bacterium]
MQKRIPHDLDWDALRLLLAAARARSLTGAARALKLDQSTASRRLAALERALGVRLFDRVPGGLEPTPVAIQVLPLAEAAEAQVLELLRTAAGADEALQGTVRVAVPEAMDSGVLVPALGAFYERYPRVRLEVVAGAALANLSRREADVGLRLVRPQAGEFVALRVAWLSVGAWGTKALVALGAGRAPWVGWDDEAGFRAESGWLSRHVAPDQVRLRCNRLEALAAAARAGLGLALLPDAMARLAGGLTRLELPGLAPALPLWLVAHKALLRVPRVRVVWEFLREEAARAMAG